jgi:hypothetical protein
MDIEKIKGDLLMVSNIKSYIRAATQTNLKRNLPEII